MQKFGGDWTVLKLEKVEDYLQAYTIALKDIFKLCYIDAFAGNGIIETGASEAVVGSAIRALNYPFNRYFFFDENPDNCGKLEEIALTFPAKDIIIKCCDSNEMLMEINSFQWKNNGWRGVIFLDPFAMEIDWKTLACISRTEAFDVWYLFPISAMNRNLYNNGKMPDGIRSKLDRFLGTDAWYDDLYKPTGQISLFGEEETSKINYSKLADYILKRLGEIFHVSNKPLYLKNSMNSILFLLCFLVSNPDQKAIALSSRIANHILTH